MLSQPTEPNHLAEAPTFLHKPGMLIDNLSAEWNKTLYENTTQSGHKPTVHTVDQFWRHERSTFRGIILRDAVIWSASWRDQSGKCGLECARGVRRSEDVCGCSEMLVESSNSSSPPGTPLKVGSLCKMWFVFVLKRYKVWCGVWTASSLRRHMCSWKKVTKHVK